MREVEVVSGMSHSNLGQVYGYGQEMEGAPYLVMEFVEGQNLEEILKVAGKLKLTRAIDLFMQICSGLICAHSNGIIHRDLKPSNVIVQSETNGQERAAIVDFGFARILSDAKDTMRMTQEGEVLGSPAYMSPEQCLGEELDVRSDIYSLGCLMYEVLVGIPPLLGENILGTVAKHIRGTVPSMRLSDATIPDSIDTIVLKCLDKEPLLRYQSVSHLRADLDKVKKGEYVVASAKRSHNLAKTSAEARSLRSTEDVHRRVTSMAGIVLLAAVLIGGGTGLFVWMFLQKQNAATISSPPPAAVSVPEPQLSGHNSASSAALKAAKEPNPRVLTNHKHQQHKQNPVASIAVHSKNEAHPLVHTIAAPRHPAAPHGSESKTAGSSGWDELKGLRQFK